MSTTQDGETSSCLKEDEENPCADKDPTVKNLVVGSVENECTSNFFVSVLQITDRDVVSWMGGETPFGSDPKGGYKSELQSPLEPYKEKENKATPLGCEPKNLVDEHATLVSLREDGKMKNMDDKVFDFSIFVSDMIICSHLIHGRLKRLHLPIRSAEGRTMVREKKSLLVSLLVNTKSMQRRVILLIMIRYLLDWIQKNIYQI